MPRPAHLSQALQSEGFPAIGSGARALRIARGLSIRELARLASINKNTVLRLERGEPVTAEVLHKVCVTLETALTSLTSRAQEPARTRVFHGWDENWVSVIQRAEAHGHLPNASSVPDGAERERYGRLGFTCGFLMTHSCTIEKGKMLAAVYEVHHPWAEPIHHPGEEFVYCLRGDVKVKVGEEVHVLSEGDSISFDSSQLHNFERLSPPPSPAPRVLSVWIEGADPIPLAKTK